MTDQELAATYVALLPILWSGTDTPLAQETIDMLATTAIASQIVGQVLGGFALTNIYGQTPAVGKQLDVLGQFVGAQRVLATYDPGASFFGHQDTTGSFNPDAGGFADASSSTPPSDYWDSTNQTFGNSYVLSDAQMLALIEYLVAVNHGYLSLETIDNILFAAFGTFVTVAEGNMKLTYTQSPSDPGTLFGIVDYLGKLPHPAGVEVVVVPG